MQDNTEIERDAPGYWNNIGSKSEGSVREELWRAYLKEVYRALASKWRNAGGSDRSLKTDLYDEAVSAYDLFSLFENGSACMVGADISLATARAARHRLGQTGRAARCIAVSDTRRQCFKSCVFDEILSNSTLDHFSTQADLLKSLQELHRIMRPGGVLILTLDNPRNPAVWLRNHLPYRVLRWLGIIPFFMGVTLSRPALKRALESVGFKVTDSAALVHSPRILAIWAGSLLQRTKWERMKAGFIRLLSAIEGFDRLPTRDLTGYYVAVKAVRP